jgi:hypothetical protein
MSLEWGVSTCTLDCLSLTLYILSLCLGGPVGALVPLSLQDMCLFHLGQTLEALSLFLLTAKDYMASSHPMGDSVDTASFNTQAQMMFLAWSPNLWKTSSIASLLLMENAGKTFTLPMIELVHGNLKMIQKIRSLLESQRNSPFKN